MENPTITDGASIQDRIESLLAAEDAPAEQAENQTETDVDVETPEGDEGETSEAALSLTDLATYLKADENLLDVDEAGDLAFKVKIDGQEGKAKLQDLLTSYQLRRHLDNETRAVAEQRKAIQAHMAQAEQAMQQRFQYAEDLAGAAQSELMRRFNSIDWQTLRVTDPAEYAALYQDFQAQQSNINGISQRAQAERQQYAAQNAEQFKQNLAQEAQQLPAVIPEWKDPQVAERERNEIMDWGLKAGIPESDLKSVNRAAYVAVLRKAMLYDRMQGSKAAVENKVRTAPKLVKPGQAASNSADQTIKTLRANIRKTGGKHGSVADYLLATGKV